MLIHDQFHSKLLYQFSGTTIKCVWLRIARMEMDYSLKTSGWLWFVSPQFKKIIRFPSVDVLGVFRV